ncbi:hypothetical protein M758_6G037800 [Ceratodon purpureus]|nr:hypothetical protein M758_6G037800 [Ceratodon purpureus]
MTNRLADRDKLGDPGREPPAPLQGLRPSEAKIAIDNGRAITKQSCRPLKECNGRERGVVGCVFWHRHTCHNCRPVCNPHSTKILHEPILNLAMVSLQVQNTAHTSKTMNEKFVEVGLPTPDDECNGLIVTLFVSRAKFSTACNLQMAYNVRHEFGHASMLFLTETGVVNDILCFVTFFDRLLWFFYH